MPVTPTGHLALEMLRVENMIAASSMWRAVVAFPDVDWPTLETAADAAAGTEEDARAAVVWEREDSTALSQGTDPETFLPRAIIRHLTDAEITRIPASVSAYLRAQSDRLDVGVGLGLAVEGLNISGRGDLTPQNETRVQVGGRAAAYLRFVASQRWGLFSELAGTFVPSTYDIELAPRGVVGSTPAAWLGLTLGGTMTLR